MINEEIVERIARAANGGSSFTNDYAKKHMIKIITKALFALTKEDCENILKEIENNLK